MGMFYRVSEKQLLADRNSLIKEVGIPSLLKNGFIKSPFLGIWFGEYDNNTKGYSYELCRLTNDKILEVIDFSALKDEPWIKVNLNIYQLEPAPNQIEDLAGKDGLNFHLPPNSLTKMRLRSDDYKGPPLFYMLFLPEYKIGNYYTKSGYEAEIKKLKKLIKSDMENIDHFVKRWYEIYRNPIKTTWEGNPI